MGGPGRVVFLALVLLLASTQLAESRKLWGGPFVNSLRGFFSRSSYQEDDFFVPLERFGLLWIWRLRGGAKAWP